MIFDGLNPPYRTIVVDPPWPDRRGSTIVLTRVGRVPMDRSIAAQYSTLSLEEIRCLPVLSLADPTGCHLYLWTTNLDLPDAFAILAGWGFTYKALLTWVKEGHLGLGYHWRNSTEHLLFGTVGSLRTADRGLRTHFVAPKTGHSIKPEAAYTLIEKASPGPYVDVFARRKRLGWDVFGDQIHPQELLPLEASA